MNKGTRCTIEVRSGAFCDAPAAEWAPFPICAHHAMRLYQVMDATITATQNDPVQASLLWLDAAQDRTARPVTVDHERDPVVYFLLIDGLVKIGYASNLQRRLVQYPPTAKLLATEPGDKARETQLHGEFAEYRAAGREWFTPGPRLREYIEQLPDYRAA